MSVKKMSVEEMQETLARFKKGPMSAPAKKKLFDENPEFKEMNEEYGDVVKELHGKTAWTSRTFPPKDLPKKLNKSLLKKVEKWVKGKRKDSLFVRLQDTDWETNLRRDLSGVAESEFGQGIDHIKDWLKKFSRADLHKVAKEYLESTGKGFSFSKKADLFTIAELEDALAGRTWDGDRTEPDNHPYHPGKRKEIGAPPLAGEPGSDQRHRYNKWWKDNFMGKEAFAEALFKYRKMAAKKVVTDWMWVISKDSGGGYIITLGDPKKSSSKIKARFSGKKSEVKNELKLWLRDNKNKVSPNHIIDISGMKLVPAEWDQKFIDSLPEKSRKQLKLAQDLETMRSLVAAPIGKGKNGYIAIYKRKRIEVMADTSYQAQQIAAKHFRARRESDVTVMLAEKGGKQVTHAPIFAGEEIDAQFEKGKPADPTENMSPEDAAKWKEENEKNKDKFKEADLTVSPVADVDPGMPDDEYPSDEVDAGRTWDGDRTEPDNYPYGPGKRKEIGAPPLAGEPGSDQRHKYNKWWKDNFGRSARERMTARLKLDAGNKLYALVYGDGSLYGATTDRRGGDSRYWQHSGVIKPNSTWVIYELRGVPDELAEKLIDQGTTAQSFRDGYEAWDAAKRYVKNWIEMDEDMRDNWGHLGIHGLRNLKIATETEIVGTVASSPKTEPTQVEVTSVTAAPASGLYGYTKALQGSVEASIRKLQRKASKLAKQIYAKDQRVSEFLSAHVKRSKSTTAKVLVAAMQDLGPKFASETPVVKEGKQYGLYGYPSKTANLGLTACTSLKEEAGLVASGLHSRKAGLHEQITGFLKQHSRSVKCSASKMLLTAYPDVSIRLASSPETVSDWLALPMD